MSEPFRVRDCTCPNAPHPDGDVVFFPPQLDLNAGLAVTSAIANASDEDELEVRLRRALFVWGPDGWNLMEEDKKGELVPKPFDRRRLEAEFGWNAGGFEIAEEANRRFSEAAIAPLAARLKRLSANGATGSSSSPKRRTKAGTPKPSASSSPTPSAASTAPTP